MEAHKSIGEMRAANVHCCHWKLNPHISPYLSDGKGERLTLSELKLAENALFRTSKTICEFDLNLANIFGPKPPLIFSPRKCQKEPFWQLIWKWNNIRNVSFEPNEIFLIFCLSKKTWKNAILVWNKPVGFFMFLFCFLIFFFFFFWVSHWTEKWISPSALISMPRGRRNAPEEFRQQRGIEGR